MNQKVQNIMLETGGSWAAQRCAHNAHLDCNNKACDCSCHGRNVKPESEAVYKTADVDWLLDEIARPRNPGVPDAIRVYAERVARGRNPPRVKKDKPKQWVPYSGFIADLGSELDEYIRQKGKGGEKDMQVIIILKTLDAERLEKLDVVEMIETYVSGRAIVAGFEEFKIPVPEWLPEKLEELKRAIALRRRDTIKRALEEANRKIRENQSREDRLKTANEEKARLEKELAEA
jgi:hypothetical protein